MKYFYDTEFIEDGHTIDLVSIGVAAEDGREFYAVSTEFNPDKAVPWVRDNVLAQLPARTDRAWMARVEIRDWLHRFLLGKPDSPPELWAYFGAYDHVAYAQLWGPMVELPDGLPMYTNELMQLWNNAGRPEKPAQPDGAHDALVDARWNRALHQRCVAALSGAAR